MNRKKLKEQAKTKIKGNLWNIIMPFFVVGLIESALLSAFGGNSDNLTKSMTASLITSLLISPLSYGCVAYVVNFVRGKEYNLKDVFSHYKKFGVIFGLNFLVSLFVTLWSCLFIIPGIIASFSYSMVFYIMIDGEENPMECIKKSKAMMQGYKWDYFKLLLSFIGWILLMIPTLGIIMIYVSPYMTVTEILYYEELKKISKM